MPAASILTHSVNRFDPRNLLANEDERLNRIRSSEQKIDGQQFREASQR
jgi:hypothetical protein